MLKVTSIGAPTATASKKIIEDAAKASAVVVVRQWHEKDLPKHFTVAGGKLYGYQPRSGDNEPPRLPITITKANGSTYTKIRANPHYSWRKRRNKRHNKPLVWSGQSEEDAESMVKLSSRVSKAAGEVIGTAAMPNLPRYFYKYRTDLKMPDKAAELVRTTPAEEQELAATYQSQMSLELSERMKFPGMKKIA